MKSLTEKLVELEVLVGKKKKEKVVITIPFEDILEAKAVISFKK